MKFDRRRKYYMVFDCETATMPQASNYDSDAKKAIAIAKPLIYDFGYQIIDNRGRVYKRVNYLISEIFSVPSIFNTAYYASKRPIYLERLRKGDITLTNWDSAIAELMGDMQDVVAVGAYNAMFDFVKAIPFTESYIRALYSPDFFEWEARQNRTIDNIASGKKARRSNSRDVNTFSIRGISRPIFDIWGLSCEYLLNNDDFRTYCIRTGQITDSGKYYKTSAECAYRFIRNNTDFVEAHTALEDVIIESEIFALVHKKSKGKWNCGIVYFPFRLVGVVD